MRRWRASLACGVVALMVVAGGATAALRSPAAPALATLSVGQSIGPGGIVVDPRGGHAFIAAGTSGASGVPVSSVTMLDVRTGTVLRRVGVGGIPPYLALDARHGHILAVSTNLTGSAGRVTILDATTGAILRTAAVGTTPAALAVDTPANRLYIASGAGCALLPLACHRDAATVFVLDTRTLRVVRALPVRSVPHAIVVDERGGHAFLIYNVGVDLLDAATGRLLRHISGITGVLDVNRPSGHIVASAGGGVVRVLDARGRRVLHSVSLGSSLVDGAVDVDQQSGNIWIASITSFPALAGRVDILDGASGRLLHAIPVGRLPDAVAVDARTHRAFVLSQMDSTVSVIDTRAWHVLRTVPVGLSPTTLAVDDAANRVIVGAMQTPAVQPRDPWSWVPLNLRRRLPFLPPPPAASHPLPGGVTLLGLAP